MSTVVALHAHPDDESLLTGGTLAGLAARGHRVVVVMATSGEVGLAADPTGLGERRREEAERAARALGAARVVHLGYADSGWTGDPHPVPGGFSAVAVAEAAARVAAVLTDERADLLLGYDRAGGYGHPDHVQVHRVATEAARLAGTRLLEATVDRTWYRRLLHVLARLRLLPAGTDLAAADRAYCARAELTHRVPVRSGLAAKRRALECHASQAGGGEGARTVALLLRLPRPLFALVAGNEWFVEPGTPRPPRLLPDVLTAAGPRRAGATTAGVPDLRGAP